MSASPSTDLSLSAGGELLRNLSEAATALSRGDTESADGAMEAAARACQQMQEAGVAPTATELAALQDLAQQCGASLEKLASALNAESLRDDNHRRALLTYHASLQRP